MLLIFILTIFSACQSPEPQQLTDTEKQVVKLDINKKMIELANEFVDVFYSFNRDKLDSALTYANDSKPSILYYQGWAEGGNYEIIERHPFIAKDDTLVICPVTVKDDLIAALNIDFWVTDTFHVAIKNGQIISVNTSSNDPPLYYEAWNWVLKNRSQLIEVPCQDMWEGGPTPGECARTMLKGYLDFVETKKMILLK